MGVSFELSHCQLLRIRSSVRRSRSYRGHGEAFGNGFVDKQQFGPKRVPRNCQDNQTNTNPNFLHFISPLAGLRRNKMKKVWIGIGLVVLAIAWYAFRPELLFIDKSVSESFPVTSVAATTPDAGSDPKQLAMGQFKGYAHETQGNADVYEVNGKRVLRLTHFKT